MKIDVLQIPKGQSNSKGVNGVEPQDGFSQLLAQTIAPKKESIDETTNKLTKPLETEVEEQKGDELEADLPNPLAVLLSLLPGQEIHEDLNILGEENLEIIDEMSFSTMDYTMPDLNMVENINGLDENIFALNYEIPVINEEVITAENTMNLNIETDPTKDIMATTKPKANPVVAPIIEIDSNPVFKNIIQELELNMVEVPEMVIEEIADMKEEDISLQDNKWMNTNMGKVETTSFKPEINPKGVVLSDENIERVNDSIIELMETTTEGNTSTMKVELYPEDMGTVNVTLKMEDGKLVARIAVDNNHIKELFTSRIDELNVKLIKQNINMEGISIELNTDSNTNLNHNSNPNPNEDFNQNTRSSFKRSQMHNLSGKSMEKIFPEEHKAESGTISILA